MKYEQFDEDKTPRQIYTAIIKLLNEGPRERKDIYDNINADDTKIDYQIQKLMKNDIVDKKYFENKWYYGLTLKYRKEIEELHKNDELIEKSFLKKIKVNK